MMDVFDQYYEVLVSCLNKILANEKDAISKAGKYIGEWLGKDKKNLLYVIGTGGHSIMAGTEMFKRAGGMPCVSPIFSNAAYYERVPGLIEKDLIKYNIPEGAPIIIASHMGMNSFTIETAEICKKKGLFTIGIEATDVLSQLPDDFAGWSASKKTLRDICDITINHNTPYGDATVRVDGIDCPGGPVSNLLIFFILHSIELATYRYMGEKGTQPPIYMSLNIPGGEEHNATFDRDYGDLVKAWLSL